MTIMKLKFKCVSVVAALFLLVGTTACFGDSARGSNAIGASGDGCAASESSSSGDGSPITVKVSGDINIDRDNSQLVGQEASISFNHFPNSLSQFEAILPTLKETPQGAVAAQLMAMELYRRNRDEGEKAFALCNVKSNVHSIMERVPDLFGYAGTAYGGDGYARPYQVASFLQGANRDNGYTPTEPYTVKVKVSPNGAVYSENYQAKMLYLNVITQGNDQGNTPCQVVNTRKPGEPTGWIIFNCPGLYSQCKEIGYGTDFKGLK